MLEGSILMKSLFDNEFRMSMAEASRGGDANLPFVNCDVEGYKIDSFFPKYFGERGMDTKPALDFLYVKSENKKIFIEFKSGNYGNIKCKEINEKIACTLIVYFAEQYDSIENCRNNNELLLVVKDGHEKMGYNLLETKSVKTEKEVSSLDKVLKFYEGFCFCKVEIVTVSKFKEYINNI